MIPTGKSFVHADGRHLPVLRPGREGAAARSSRLEYVGVSRDRLAGSDAEPARPAAGILARRGGQPAATAAAA